MITKSNEITDILVERIHRPYAMPDGNWTYYQEWNNVLFLHWKIPAEILRQLVPENLEIDLYEGNAWISLVAFSMEQIRPRNLPAVGFISNFHEINLRTYVVNGGKPGVYFINIEAEKQLSAWIAKAFSGLPYEKAEITRTQEASSGTYFSNNKKKGFSLDAVYEKAGSTHEKSALDKWLTERYCLYMNKQNTTFCYDIHHKEWEIEAVTLKQLNLQYKASNFSLTGIPDFAHFSKGVKVLAWKRQPIK